ncbi:hypothetical protein GH714_030482 [Hevea brasiliensis]|uniref:Uncharacterized protein n=1 Tax=Hevea brasiliensis TaxID=3981 RepID=A0A6A6M2Y4_HEVBR|nr:hypothetical protein GH714_030435 [Hevea brasiliensis]KAF2307632.1 hypothetical protein GH714_030448 [Hevea brasiliensis]KAF2307634.1 hypothetical protein GH714_030455 [Hevea brasiliensis]KAF2307636.1 hypothetical protein GH714_030482 [Hevea brasiliensis]
MNKSPGPDGLTAAFYQRFWVIAKPDACRACLECLNHERIETAEKGRVDVTVCSALDIFGGNLSYMLLLGMPSKRP